MIVTVESEYMLNRSKSTVTINALIILNTFTGVSTSTLSGILQSVAFLVNNFVLICYFVPGSLNVILGAKMYVFYKQVEIVKKEEKMLNGMEDVSTGWLDRQPLPIPFPGLPPLLGKASIPHSPLSYSNRVAMWHSPGQWM